MASNSPVISSEDSDYPALMVRSKRMFNDLLSLGGMQKKSTKIRLPSMPSKYLRDFIRGYFDGDGSVHFVSYSASKNGKRYTHLRSNFTCGNKLFLDDIKRILEERLGLFNRKICQYGPHQFKLSYGEKDTHKLLEYMYYVGHSISLPRKEAYCQVV